MSEVREHVYQDYLKNTEGHSLEVRQDSEEYRHLSFSCNGSNFYRFDLITWPGYLTICGDMGTYTFSRVRDMFSFFREENPGDIPSINPSYWAEKLEGVDRNSPVKEFSIKLFRNALTSELEGQGFQGDEFNKVWAQVREDILDGFDYDSEAHYIERAMEFKHGDGDERLFSEIYEYDCKEFTFHYLWVLYAIVDGIRQYDAVKEEEERTQQADKEAWTPSEAIRHLDANLKIHDLEEAGLVIEGKDEFRSLIEKGGALYEPLMDTFREGRKHAVSIAPRDRSFFDADRVKSALKSAFGISDSESDKAIEQLNWARTDTFENGHLPEGFNNYLVLVDEESITFTQEGPAIITTECQTSLTWQYTIISADGILKNNGTGRHTAPYGYYAFGTAYDFSESKGGFRSQSEAVSAAREVIMDRIKAWEEF